jgi:phage baseplate assembly protein W
MAAPSPRSPGAAKVPTIGAGWSLPVARTEPAGRLAMAADEDSVRQSIFIILSTAKGERLMRPDFGCGLHDYVFAVNDRATQAAAAFEVREALLRWEPRIDLLEVEAESAGSAAEVLLLSITYRVRSTDNRFNLVYPFYLERPLA